MPQGCVERHLVMDMAMAKWRVGAVYGQETEILDQGCESRFGIRYPDTLPEARSGEGFIEVADFSRVLVALDRRENTFTRIYHRCSAHLVRTAAGAIAESSSPGSLRKTKLTKRTNNPTENKRLSK